MAQNIQTGGKRTHGGSPGREERQRGKETDLLKGFSGTSESFQKKGSPGIFQKPLEGKETGTGGKKEKTTPCEQLWGVHGQKGPSPNGSWKHCKEELEKGEQSKDPGTSLPAGERGFEVPDGGEGILIPRRGGSVQRGGSEKRDCF